MIVIVRVIVVDVGDRGLEEAGYAKVEVVVGPPEGVPLNYKYTKVVDELAAAKMDHRRLGKF